MQNYQNKNFGSLSSVAATPAVLLSSLAHKHTVAAVPTGAPASCALQLEGSLDNTNWFNLSGSQDASGGNIMFHVVDKPVMFVRINLTALSAGASVAVNYLGVF
jgi:hypothetical protein